VLILRDKLYQKLAMDNQRLIENYATALFKAAAQIADQSEVFATLQSIKEVLYDNPKCVVILSAPIVLTRDKLALVDKILGQLSVPLLIKNFLNILILKSRFDILQEIISCYSKLLNQAKGIKLVKITSSTKLTLDEQNQVKADLERLIIGKLDLTFTYDRAIIGGFVVEYDNYLLDSSIMGALARIEKLSIKNK
jgi:F-type H+-transporting ATPase subunit delta